MSLVPDYGESSDSESSSSSGDSDSEDNLSFTKEASHKDLPKPKLPTPNFGPNSDSTEDTKSSVFKNPFVEAENAKEAILQKHVKMVDTKDNVKVINGKQICWNYRKGRCRFGHNCKFAHDSDIQKTEEQIEKDKISAVQNSVVCQGNQTGHTQYITQAVSNDSEDLEDSAMITNKRKRPGLTQGLVPGKKVMKQYIQNRALPKT